MNFGWLRHSVTAANVNVIDTAIIPIGEDGIVETLRKAISERGLEKTETLVAIGRGKAELRELTLPPVPEDELPDMVRFQAIRSFASSGESATVDYLVTDRKDGRHVHDRRRRRSGGTERTHQDL